MDSSTVGLVGEMRVQKMLNLCKMRFDIRYISNLPLYYNNDYYQVDDVIVCSKGFYAVEVKNWNCEVNCGSSRYWKVKYPTREIVVRSPLSQNTAHCRKIEKITGTMPVNIVLFMDGAVLKDPPEGIMLASKFPNFLANQEDIFTQEYVDKLYQSLVEYKKKIEPQMIMEFILKRAKV